MAGKIKIGIIQNAPLTADFSQNLRQIVQGYRACLDHGPDLIIAPACALCGAETQDLANRRSFLAQALQAMECLAKELGETPLLLANYTSMPELMHMEAEDEDDDGAAEPEIWHSAPTRGLMVPYLLEQGNITELEDSEVVDFENFSIYVDLHDEEVLIDDMEPDFIIHLPQNSWHGHAAQEEEEKRQWEAQTNGVPVVCVRHIGTANGHIFAGGSGVYLPNGSTQVRLPFFQKDNKTCTLGGSITAKSLPREEELLAEALKQGIRDYANQNGFRGVCLPLDAKYSPLLAILSAEALGSHDVHGITFQKNTQVAKTLGLHIRELNLTDLCENAATVLELEPDHVLRSRLENTALMTYADSKYLMPLSVVTRHDLLTGDFTLYGESGGYLAPLGNLYTMDAHMLSVYYKEKYGDLFGTLEVPAAPEHDRILHELADRNISAGALLNEHVCPFREDDVHSMQRRIIASALKRTQAPIVLHVDRESERINLPYHHRLND